MAEHRYAGVRWVRPRPPERSPAVDLRADLVRVCSMSAAIPVTVVVTPRERFSVAERAFNSVCGNTPGGHRFIYVAGGAPPDVREFLRRACDQPNYDLILAPNFLIPNVARNLGLARADSKYVVFLDNDVVVEPGWLDALITCAEEEEADLVGPLCLIGEPFERTLHSLGGKLIIAPEKDGINL